MNSLDDRVTQLLDLEVTSEPDDAFSYNVLIKRRVKVEDYSNNNDGNEFNMMYRKRIGIEISVRSEDIPFFGEFRASYPGTPTGEKRFEELKSFIKGIIGREAYIVYILNSRKNPVLQMIAPIQKNQLYIKGDGHGSSLLMPYQTQSPITWEHLDYSMKTLLRRVVIIIYIMFLC